MLHTTQGIVLSHIKYRETSIIAKIFTEAFGLQAYLVQGVRTKKPKYNIALFQPLTLLDMVVLHKKQRSIQRITEIRCYTPNSNILTNISKATIAIFIAEFLTKVIREEEHNEQLFCFLWQEVIRLNDQDSGYELFYLTFLLQLSHYLGFGISTFQDIYTQLHRSGQHWAIDHKTMERLNELLSSKEAHACINLDKSSKRHAMEAMIKFYQLHIDSLDTLKSLRVLQEIN
ncbi:MAG: DNA repair protein RecO [Bacteroidota bacterium]